MSILIRVVYWFLSKSLVDWIELGTLGPFELVDSCTMGLRIEPKVR